MESSADGQNNESCKFPVVTAIRINTCVYCASPEYGYLCSCVLLVLMCVYVHVCQITMLRIKINCEFSIKLRILFTVCVKLDVNYSFLLFSLNYEN